MKKVRLDKLLVDTQQITSIEEARALIMAGNVLVNEMPVTKSGTAVSTSAKLRVRRPRGRFVSRGGEKLSHALTAFGCDVCGKVVIDVGASTGGFTDCLLQYGAARVYAIDVGRGQLAEKLRRDPRVVVIDHANIRSLDPQRLPEKATFAVSDVSFISLAKIFPALAALLESKSCVIALVKPQFELPREAIEWGGVVRNPKLHTQAVAQVIQAAKENGWQHQKTTPSPILGAKGNREFFVLLETA